MKLLFLLDKAVVIGDWGIKRGMKFFGLLLFFLFEESYKIEFMVC